MYNLMFRNNMKNSSSKSKEKLHKTVYSKWLDPREEMQCKYESPHAAPKIVAHLQS